MNLILDKYIEHCETYLANIWGNLQYDLNNSHRYDVVGGLLHRQLILAVSMAESNILLTPHLAPLILRPMVELIITLKWIILDLDNRTQQFIEYGLGRHQLVKEKMYPSNPNYKINEYLDQWLNSQRREEFINLNLGSWSGTDIRKMSEDVDLKDLYDGAFDPFSAAVHNQWHHVGKYDVMRCKQALHKFHFIPGSLAETWISDEHYLLLSAKYLDLAFEAVRSTFQLDLKDKSCLKYLSQILDSTKNTD